MRLPWQHGALETAAWIGDDTLIAGGWCLAPAGALEAVLHRGADTIPLRARWIGYSRPDLPDRPHPLGRIIVLRFPRAADARPLRGTIVLRSGTTRFATTARSLERILVDPITAIRSRVWVTNPQTRAEITAFLFETLDVTERLGKVAEHLTEVVAFLLETLDGQSATAVDIAHGLAAVLGDLRSGGSAHARSPEEPGGVSLDTVLRIDDRSFYVRGRAHDPSGEPAGLTVISPEGERVELLHRAFRHTRSDVLRSSAASAAKTAFVAHVGLEQPSLASHGWTIRLLRRDGLVRESSGPPVTTSRPTVRDALLADLDLDRAEPPRLLERHIHPALSRLQEVDVGDTVATEVVELGAVPCSPELSIVVPLYQRLDLLEPQLAHFVDDPEMRGVELIYVLDSPEQADDLRVLAHQLHELYRLPLRVVFQERNLGFARSSNQGARVARGRLLVLLNSDVFPAHPGWTGTLGHFYDSRPRIGALGPKLLFEDDTLQHAGMYFSRPAGGAVWGNQHFYKGFHGGLPAANVVRPVPAVTAACVMIARDLYLEHGGLRGLYVHGDYEDSDLCLRLLAAGYENWYLPEVALYHLEAQSYAGERRARASRYNAWLHTRLWGETIEAVMARFAGLVSDQRPVSIR